MQRTWKYVHQPVQHRSLQTLTLDNLLYQSRIDAGRIDQAILAPLLLGTTITTATLLFHRWCCWLRSTATAACHNNRWLCLHRSGDGTLRYVEELLQLATSHVRDVMLLHFLDHRSSLRQPGLLGTALTTTTLLDGKLMPRNWSIPPLHSTWVLMVMYFFSQGVLPPPILGWTSATRNWISLFTIFCCCVCFWRRLNTCKESLVSNYSI